MTIAPAAATVVRHARSAPARTWSTLWDYLRRVWLNIGDDKLLFLSGAIAFNLLLVVLPFAVLVVAGLAAVVGRGPAASTARIHEIVDLLLPPHAEGPDSPVHQLLDQLMQARGRIGLYAAIGFAFFASRIFGTLRNALSDVFDIEQSKGLLLAKLSDFAMTVVTSGLAVAYLMLTGYLALVTPEHASFLGVLGIQTIALSRLTHLGATLLGFGFVVTMFFLLYRYLPNRNVRWQAALIGALVASLLFEIARKLYLAYTDIFFSRSLSSGTVFALISILGWVYYGAFIFLIGGEVAQAHEIRRILRLHRETFGAAPGRS